MVGGREEVEIRIHFSLSVDIIIEPFSPSLCKEFRESVPAGMVHGLDTYTHDVVFTFNIPFHAARFSPDDKFSRQRIVLKKRFGLLLTQSSPVTHQQN